MPSGEWTDGAFPVLDPRGFYSTSGACSVSPFTTMVSGEGSAKFHGVPPRTVPTLRRVTAFCSTRLASRR
jgi:hypothetical protein